MTRIVIIGNFEPTHSTENEWKRGLEDIGVHVDTLQENAFTEAALTKLLPADALWYVRTWGTAVPWLRLAEHADTPTVSPHLDLWFGIKRAADILREPMWRADYVYTADGGHDVRFQASGVNHRFMPPAMSAHALEGVYNARFEGQVAFVGSHPNRYHREWTWRRDLFNACANLPGWVHYDHADKMRGQVLSDLYVSASVIVGDSLALASRYWSDRLPETLGRGGNLVWPEIDGCRQTHSTEEWTEYTIGDVASLIIAIDEARGVAADKERRARNRSRILAAHTYTHRAARILDDLGLGHDAVPEYQ